MIATGINPDELPKELLTEDNLPEQSPVKNIGLSEVKVKSDEEIQRAAETAYWASQRVNSVNFIFDLIQLGALTKVNKAVTRNADGITRGLFGRMTVPYKVAKEADILYKNKIMRAIHWAVTNPYIAEATEAFEEGINTIGQKEGERAARLFYEGVDDDYTDLSDRLRYYLKDPELHDSMIWGLISGIGGSYILGKMGFDDHSEYIKQKVAEVAARNKYIKQRSAQLQAVLEGKQYTNPTGGEVYDYSSLDEDEKIAKIKDITSDMAFNMGVSASKSGNVDLLLRDGYLDGLIRDYYNDKRKVLEEEVAKGNTNAKKELENLPDEDTISDVISTMKKSILSAEKLYKKASKKFRYVSNDPHVKSNIIDRFIEYSFSQEKFKERMQQLDNEFTSMYDELRSDLGERAPLIPEIEAAAAALARTHLSSEVKQYKERIKKLKDKKEKTSKDLEEIENSTDALERLEHSDKILESIIEKYSVNGINLEKVGKLLDKDLIHNRMERLILDGVNEKISEQKNNLDKPDKVNTIKEKVESRKKEASKEVKDKKEKIDKIKEDANNYEDAIKDIENTINDAKDFFDLNDRVNNLKNKYNGIVPAEVIDELSNSMYDKLKTDNSFSSGTTGDEDVTPKEPTPTDDKDKTDETDKTKSEKEDKNEFDKLKDDEDGLDSSISDYDAYVSDDTKPTDLEKPDNIIPSKNDKKIREVADDSKTPKDNKTPEDSKTPKKDKEPKTKKEDTIKIPPIRVVESSPDNETENELIPKEDVVKIKKNIIKKIDNTESIPTNEDKLLELLYKYVDESIENVLGKDKIKKVSADARNYFVTFAKEYIENSSSKLSSLKNIVINITKSIVNRFNKHSNQDYYKLNRNSKIAATSFGFKLSDNSERYNSMYGGDEIDYPAPALVRLGTEVTFKILDVDSQIAKGDQTWGELKKEHEEKYKEEKEKYNDFYIKNVPIGVFVKDDKGNEVQVGFLRTYEGLNKFWGIDSANIGLTVRHAILNGDLKTSKVKYISVARLLSNAGELVSLKEAFQSKTDSVILGYSYTDSISGSKLIAKRAVVKGNKTKLETVEFTSDQIINFEDLKDRRLYWNIVKYPFVENKYVAIPVLNPEAVVDDNSVLSNILRETFNRIEYLLKQGILDLSKFSDTLINVMSKVYNIDDSFNPGDGRKSVPTFYYSIDEMNSIIKLKLGNITHTINVKGNPVQEIVNLDNFYNKIKGVKYHSNINLAAFAYDFKIGRNKISYRDAVLSSAKTTVKGKIDTNTGEVVFFGNNIYQFDFNPDSYNNKLANEPKQPTPTKPKEPKNPVPPVKSDDKNTTSTSKEDTGKPVNTETTINTETSTPTSIPDLNLDEIDNSVKKLLDDFENSGFFNNFGDNC